MKDFEVLLPEKAVKEMEYLISGFKNNALEELRKALTEVYTEIGIHAETDSWINFREQLRLALAHDRGWAEEDNSWARNVRERILKDHTEELVGLLNKDLVKQNEELKEECKRIQKWRSEI